MKYLKNITGLVLAVIIPLMKIYRMQSIISIMIRMDIRSIMKKIMMQMLIMMMERCWQGLLLHRIQSLDVTCRNGREEMMEI